jgi:hypothetical protein
MALVLDATVGGVASNTYLLRAEADVYFESRLYATPWTGATSANKDIALVWATRLLDRSVEWNGYVTSQQQALRWPRAYAFDADQVLIPSDVIPNKVKEATAELAMWLLQKDRTAETGREGIRSMSVGKISFEFDKLDTPPTIPDAVYQLIASLGELKEVSSGGVGVARLLRT